MFLKDGCVRTLITYNSDVQMRGYIFWITLFIKLNNSSCFWVQACWQWLFIIILCFYDAASNQLIILIESDTLRW